MAARCFAVAAATTSIEATEEDSLVVVDADKEDADGVSGGRLFPGGRGGGTDLEVYK